MPRPRKKGVVGIKIRLATDLISQLEAAAKKHKISFNHEATRRLGLSFGEEKAFGGEEGRRLLYFIATAFVLGGNRAAQGRKLSAWIKDPDAYTAAMFALLHALMIGQPGATLERCLLQVESLKGRVATHFSNKGKTP